jgi:hypothetical protein
MKKSQEQQGELCEGIDSVAGFNRGRFPSWYRAIRLGVSEALFGRVL